MDTPTRRDSRFHTEPEKTISRLQEWWGNGEMKREVMQQALMTSAPWTLLPLIKRGS